MHEITPEASIALKFIENTSTSLFLTGKAGTGKTTLLHEIIKSTKKQFVVVAPTGIAAINASGMTIHSFFQLPFHSFIPDESFESVFDNQTLFESRASLKKHFILNSNKKKLVQSLELLIIDEVSMLRPDILDAMDFMLKTVRKNLFPFGGVQVLFVGDLHQLPPVIKENEWNFLSQFYANKYFYAAKVFQTSNLVSVELKKIFRQNDAVFVDLLNKIRNDALFDLDLNFLNQFYKPNFDIKKNPGYIHLTTHNYKANNINVDALNALDSEIFEYTAEIEGNFSENNFPNDEVLKLKKGAQIIFIKNDISQSKDYYNGKMGVIDSLSNDYVTVKLLDSEKTIYLEKYEWRNIRYEFDEVTKKINENVVGTFKQYPIRLAWAITIHKSQGLTFEKASMDLSDCFAPGQTYVAISRLKSLEGLVLTEELNDHFVLTDDEITSFNHEKNNLNLNHIYETELFYQFKKDIIYVFDWNNTKTSLQALDKLVKSFLEKDKTLNFFSWFNDFSQKFQDFFDIAIKFQDSISKISNDKKDYSFVIQRFNAAKEYFYPDLLNNFFKLRRIILDLDKKEIKKWYKALHNLSNEIVFILASFDYTSQWINQEDFMISKTNLDFSEFHQNAKKQLLLLFKQQQDNNLNNDLKLEL